MEKFIRRNDYSQKVLEEVRELLDEGILMIPNKDCFKGYENGLVLISKLTEKTLNIIGDDKQSIKSYQNNHLRKGDGLYEMLDEYLTKRVNHRMFFENNREKIRSVVRMGMPSDRERASSQIISLTNMSFDDDKYSVCGWEVAFPRKYIAIPKGTSLSELKKPEIDLVLVNPSKKEMILVEYKCNGDSMTGSNQNIAQHCIDYLQILYSNNMNEVRNEMMKAFNVYRRIKGKSEISENEFKEYKVKIGFLLIDEIYIDGKLDSGISENDYKKAIRLLDDNCQYLGDNVVYIRKRTIEEIDFNTWQIVRDSELRLTD